MFEPTIVSDVVIATAFGFAVAFAFYSWSSKSKASLRFIDLVSFGIGFLAICAGLIAVYDYRSDSEKNQHRLRFKLDTVQASLETQIQMAGHCERNRHTPYAVSAIRVAECKKLEEYLKTLIVNDDLPTVAVLYPPNVALYTDPLIQGLAQRVATSVSSANAAIKLYNEDVAYHSRLTLLESIFRELALPVLAWAFGLGLGRRMIDLCRDMSETSQQRLRKFSGYNLARRIATRALRYISNGFSVQLARFKKATRLRS